MLIQFEAFGPDFFHCFTTDFVGREALSIAEQALIADVAEKREKDFSTGRMCARQALAALGYPETDILIGGNREPLWPKDVTGSISHSGRLTGAIVSKKEVIGSLGLDIEAIGGVKEDLWGTLFSEEEQRFLNDFDIEQKQVFSTLLFSLKESFYKLQYPITETFLEFLDVEIRFENGGFIFYSNHPFTAKMPALSHVSTQWLQFGDQVISLCSLSNLSEL